MHLAEAFLLEHRIANGEHLIDQKDLGIVLLLAQADAVALAQVLNGDGDVAHGQTILDE